jgi:hypothetical protein
MAPTARTCGLAETTLDHIMITLPTPTAQQPQHLCLDAGYEYEAVSETVQAHHSEPHFRPNLHNRTHAKPETEPETERSI